MKLIFDVFVRKSDDPDYDRRNIAWYNVVVLSISMLLTFSSLKTLINSMKVLVWQLHLNNPEFMVNSNHVVGVSILLLTLFYIIAPWLVFNSEPRIWMLIFAAAVIIHISILFKPIKWVLYITSGAVGITAALSSTAQSQYINLNTFFNNFGKISEVYWSLLHVAMLIGNFLAYIVLVDHVRNDIPARKDELFFSALIVLSAMGFLLVFFLGKHTVKDDEFYSIPWLLILKLIQLLLTRDMFLLIIVFSYLGIQDTFMSGVYSNALGYTLVFSEKQPLRLTTLSGILIGAGTLSAIIILSLFKKYVTFKWHIKIYTFGILLHIICYVLIMCNLPNDSVRQPTTETGAYMSNYSVALLCSYLLGFGDYCIHVELYYLLIERFENQFTPASYLQIFVTKFSSAIAYFYNSSQLIIVVGILLGMAVISIIAFGVVEAILKREAADELDVPRQRYVS